MKGNRGRLPGSINGRGALGLAAKLQTENEQLRDEIERLRIALVRFGDRSKMATVEPIELQQTIDRAFETQS